MLKKTKHRAKRTFTRDPSAWRKSHNRKWKAKVKRELQRDPEGILPTQRGTPFGYYW